MRFSSIIASTLVLYIATVASSSQAKHSLESPSSISHAQTAHLMARDKKDAPLLGGLVSGLLPGGGKKKITKKAKKAKNVKKVKKVKKVNEAKKSVALRPASLHPAAAAAPLPKYAGIKKVQIPKQLI